MLSTLEKILIFKYGRLYCRWAVAGSVQQGLYDKIGVGCTTEHLG